MISFLFSSRVSLEKIAAWDTFRDKKGEGREREKRKKQRGKNHRGRGRRKKTFPSHNSRLSLEKKKTFFLSFLPKLNHGLVVQGSLPAVRAAPPRGARRGLGAGLVVVVVDVAVFGRRRPDRRRRFLAPLLLLGRAHDRAPAGPRASDAGVIFRRSGPGHAADDAAQRGQDRLGGHRGKKEERGVFFPFSQRPSLSFFLPRLFLLASFGLSNPLVQRAGQGRSARAPEWKIESILFD